MAAPPNAILSLLTDSELLDLRKEVVKRVTSRGMDSIVKRIVASTAGGSSTTYEFDCTVNDLSKALLTQLEARNLLKHAGVRKPQRRAGINPSGL